MPSFANTHRAPATAPARETGSAGVPVVSVRSPNATPTTTAIAPSADTPAGSADRHLVEVVDDVTADLTVSPVDRESLLDLARSVSDNVLTAVQSVEGETDRAGRPKPSPARSNRSGHASARQHALPHVSPSVSRGVVQQVVRNAGATAWLDFLSSAPEPQKSPDLLPAMSSRAMLAGQDLLVAAMQAHADRSAPSTRALRARVVEHLLAGEPAEDLAARIGVRLADSYVVVGMSAACEVHLRCTDGSTGAFVARRGDSTLLLLAAPEGTLRSEAKSIAARHLTAGSEDERAAEVSAVTLASPRSSIPQAVDEVESLLRVARALNCPAQAYSVEDLSIEMALLRCPDLSSMLASRLTPLDASGAPLVETLRIYLASSQDRRQASKALHIHPNTLDYRLRRIKELTGLTPTVPRDIQVLGAALTAWQLRQVHPETPGV